jgi:hypothetical protein
MPLVLGVALENRLWNSFGTAIREVQHGGREREIRLPPKAGSELSLFGRFRMALKPHLRYILDERTAAAKRWDICSNKTCLL